MMKQFAIVCFCLMILAMIAACQPAPQALPTQAATLASTEVSPEAATFTPQPTQPPVERPTLPPTWTPSPQPGASGNSESTPTSETAPEVQQSSGQPTLEVCGSFTVDREQSALNFVAGTSPQVFWTPVATAVRYRLQVTDVEGNPLVDDQDMPLVFYSVEPRFSFDAVLFQRGKSYGWTVVPEDSRNQQMCFERGGELFAE